MLAPHYQAQQAEVEVKGDISDSLMQLTRLCSRDQEPTAALEIKVAMESFSAIGYRIEKTEDLLPTLEKAFKQEVPVIIDCPVDYSENSKLTKHLKELYGENK